MFIVTMKDWESGTYLAESVARQVAEARSGANPEAGAAIVWAVQDGHGAKTKIRVFVGRYQRGAVGKERHHGPRQDKTFDPKSGG